jgi:hypothetical protein
MKRSNEKNEYVGVRRLAPTHVLAAWVVFTLFGPANSAAADKQTTEAAKSEKVKHILESKVMTPRPINKGSETFCNAFLDDFRAQRGIEFVEPAVHVDDYDHPALKLYRDRCPSLKMNIRGIIEPRWLDEIERLGKTYDDVLNDLEYSGRAHEATANFKMFEVDIDNDAKNGKEFVFTPRDLSTQSWRVCPIQAHG